MRKKETQLIISLILMLILTSCHQSLNIFDTLPGPEDSLEISDWSGTLLDRDSDGIVDGIDFDGNPHVPELEILSANVVKGIYHVQEEKSREKFFMFTETGNQGEVLFGRTPSINSARGKLSLLLDISLDYLGFQVAFEPDGIADISSLNNPLTFFSSGDAYQQIEGRADRRDAMVITADGRVNVAYISAAYELYVVSWNGSDWEGVGCDPLSISPILPQAEMVKLEADKNGVLHLGAKNRSTGELQIFRWSGSSWIQLPAVDISGKVVNDYDIAFDGSNTLHLFYMRYSAPKLMKLLAYSGGSWTTSQDLSGFTNYYGSAVDSAELMFDSSSSPIIGYATDTPGSYFTLMRHNGSIWEVLGTETAYTRNQGISCCIDSAGVICCAYVNTALDAAMVEYDEGTNTWIGRNNGLPTSAAGILSPETEVNPVNGDLFLSLGNADAPRGELYFYDTAISQWMQHGLFHGLGGSPESSSLAFDLTGLTYGLFSYYDSGLTKYFVELIMH